MRVKRVGACGTQSVHAKLIADALTPEMLSSRATLNSIDQPLPSAVIVRWGKQCGWWVMHNCAFKNGEMDTVESSGHAIAPAYM